MVVVSHFFSLNTPARSRYSLGISWVPVVALMWLPGTHFFTSSWVLESSSLLTALRREPFLASFFLAPPSHQVIGPHCQDSPRITPLVIFGTITNWIASQCWPISSCTGSVRCIMGDHPISDPLICSNLMAWGSLLAWISSFSTASRQIRHWVNSGRVHLSLNS